MSDVRIIMTGDGSPSLFHPGVGDTFHSTHGAVTESGHIFIGLGMGSMGEEIPGPLRILELGFGTGLNAMLSLLAARERKISVLYHGVDAFPLSAAVLEGLAPGMPCSPEDTALLQGSDWNAWADLPGGFRLFKDNADIRDFSERCAPYDLVYFDAFSPDLQPELWTTEVFAKIANMCVEGAVLVTYSSKGAVRRAMTAAGWSVTRESGPPGKREVIKAVRHAG